MSTARGTRLFGLGLLAVALLLVLAKSLQAVAQQSITLQLAPISGSGVSGTATITAANSPEDVATLALDVQGLTPSESSPVHLHAGTCEQPSASAGFLGTLVADFAGRATLLTTTVKTPPVGSSQDLSLFLLGDGEHVIDLHQGAAVACGSIPQVSPGADGSAGSPSTLPIAAGAIGVLGVGLVGAPPLRHR